MYTNIFLPGELVVTIYQYIPMRTGLLSPEVKSSLMERHWPGFYFGSSTNYVDNSEQHD